MSVIDYIKAYASIIREKSPAEIKDILVSYGNAALTEYEEMPDSGEGVMTKSIYLMRKEACSICPLKTKINTCDPVKSRIHVSEKKEDGSPAWVKGCGCNLWAKQKNYEYHCPAGEW